MKKTSHTLLRSAALAALALFSGPHPLPAQSGAAPTAPPSAGGGTGKPTDDPFVNPPQAAPKPPPPHDLIIMYETYRLPQEALDDLHEAGGGNAALYEGVRRLAAAGPAKLEAVMVLPTRSGQRAALESVDELLHPAKFEPPAAGRSYSYPSFFEMTPLGERLEVDPVESPDGKVIDINFTLDFSRFSEWQPVRAEAGSEGELQPILAVRKLSTALTCPVDVPTLAGTTSQPSQSGVASGDGDGQASVTFVRVRPSLPKVAGSVPEAPKSDDQENIRLSFRFYSLPREKARDFLATTVDADKLHALVTALPPAEVKLENLITIVTRSGNRATVEENVEWLYGTEFDPPDGSKKKRADAAPLPPGGAQPEASGSPALVPPAVSSFDNRPVGWRIEVDPVVDADPRVVFVNLAPEHVQYRGIIQGHPLLARYPRNPLFRAQKVTTAVTAIVGHQCFLGTLNPPGDTGLNGGRDDGRTWFSFLTVTLEP